MQKFFQAALTAIFIVTCVFASVAIATVKLYTATAEDYASEVESQDVAKLRARDKAIKKAAKEVGVYLKTYSRSVNSELTDDEVIAITSNSWQLVGEPKYTRELVKHSAETTIIVWTATVEVNVDDSEIQRWIKRDNKDKSTIISQTLEAQKAAEENDRQIVDLREQYNRATSQAERDRIRKQMNDADRDFLANQKLEEGEKLYYAKDYYGAIKLYNEVLELKPNWDKAYNNRGNSYRVLDKLDMSIKDYNKAIGLNPNYDEAYFNRGVAYEIWINDYNEAVKDFSKAIELKPNETKYYGERGVVYYYFLQNPDLAFKDYNKIIELEPNNVLGYSLRGLAYIDLGNYEAALSDDNKLIEIKPNCAGYYRSRGDIYFKCKKYEQAIQDYNKAIELNINEVDVYLNRGACYGNLGQYERAIEDFSKIIQLNPNYALSYYNRGKCYQQIGDEAKAQADFAKAKALGYKG